MEYYTTKNGKNEISYTIDKVGNEWLLQTKSGIIKRFADFDAAEKVAIKKIINNYVGD